MLGNCKWPPPWRQPCLSCLTCMHVCAHMCVHACMCVCTCTHVGVPPPNPTPTHPPTHPQGGTPQISKNAIRLERIEIFRFRLKIWNLWRIPHPWVGVFLVVGGWMGGLVGRKMWNHKNFNKTWSNRDNSILFEDLWFVDTLPPLDRCMGGWMGGWVGQWVGSCQIIKNRVNRHLIEIIEFCLKIYDLWTHSHLWIGVWVGGWVDGWVSGSVHVKSLKIE